MSPETFQQSPSAIRCDECRAALRSGDRQAVSFLLVDQLTIPIRSCDDHGEQFAAICGLTTDEQPTLLGHRPAGGIACPGCRLSRYRSSRPVIPVRGGAIAPLACPEHQSELVQRFRTGLRTKQQLTAELGPDTGPSL